MDKNLVEAHCNVSSPKGLSAFTSPWVAFISAMDAEYNCRMVMCFCNTAPRRDFGFWNIFLHSAYLSLRFKVKMLNVCCLQMGGIN